MCVMHYRQAADIRRFFAFGVPCAVPFAHVRTRWTAFLLAVHRRDQGQEKRSLSSTSHEQYQLLVTVQGGLHSCRQCTYVTKYKGNMQQHLCRHTGVRPFECHLCSATFSRNSHLTRHIYTHTGKLPFSCHHCRASFAHKGTLVNHVVHTHPGKRLSL
ncbi:uncharacterized protein LOC119163286 isoform X1 [Rhipicephalus microplus]|uniref:uncharacterized protein LOC119163286 isoform X1 n=1 Tax=Rhipicephalus microplus TaxID=6941 RepID=UPI003F6A9787